MILAGRCGALLSRCGAVRWTRMHQKRNIIFRPANRIPPRIVGYYALLPDVPNETEENNAMLAGLAQNADWPALHATPQEIYEGAVRLLMEYGANVREHLVRLKEDKTIELNFDNVLKPILEEEYNMECAFNMAQLKMTTDWPDSPFQLYFDDLFQLRILAAKEIMEKLTNAEFQEALQHIYDTQYDETGANKLDMWQKRLVEWYLLEIRANGLHLRDSQKGKLLASWGNFVDKYRMEFIGHIMATNDQNQFTVKEREQLGDAPPHVLKHLARSNDPETGPWIAVMEPESVYELINYCRDKELRLKTWESWVSKASFEHDFFNNSVVIEEIRHNNEGFAKVLGYASISEHRLANKMAGSTETVRSFLNELVKRMRPVFMDRMHAWEAYAAANERTSAATELLPSDLFYMCRREAEHHYGVRTLDVMKHFPFWPTFNNITQIISHLLDIGFKDITDTAGLERCHPSVRIFSVHDKGTGEHLGRLYVDPFQRQGKRCDWGTLLCRPANKERGLDKIVCLLGKANEPNEQGESYLYYTQLQSLLFYLGRAIQYLVSASPYRDIAIPMEPRYAADWDAADMFPTFMQFFVYKPNMLRAIASPHAENRAELSSQADAVSLALARSTLWESYRVLFWADFDLSIYELLDRRNKFWFDLYREMYVEYFPFQRERSNYHPSSFLPIFGIQPAMSLYYRKLWVEMLALDIHETFYRESDERATGDRLKETLLRPGAGEAQAELYRRFQGRDPSVGAICDFYDPLPMEIEG